MPTCSCCRRFPRRLLLPDDEEVVKEPGPRDEAISGGWGVDSSKPPGPGLQGSPPALEEVNQLGEVTVLGRRPLPCLGLPFLLERD